MSFECAGFWVVWFGLCGDDLVIVRRENAYRPGTSPAQTSGTSSS